MVMLVGLAFNHGVGVDPRGPYTLPLRAHDGRVVTAPEWPPGFVAFPFPTLTVPSVSSSLPSLPLVPSLPTVSSLSPPPSPPSPSTLPFTSVPSLASSPTLAAYVLDRLPPVATVFARFVTDVPLASVMIRATATPLAAMSAPSPSPVPRAPEIGPTLPSIAPLTIAFAAGGDSGWCALPFDTSSLRVGVGAATTRWTWEVSHDGGVTWTALAQTVHRVYTVLSPPTEPWSVAGPIDRNPALPMAEALDVATAWARGARDVTEAAIRVTVAVNALGEGLLEYDALVGAPHYTLLFVPAFLIDAFLDRLRGGEGAGPLCNCSDCATIVSTFANLLGADLSQSVMGVIGIGFPLNPIAAIGHRTFSRSPAAFGFHEVAWTGACGEQDRVFDACLLTDADGDPTSAPHTPSLPANQIFGAVGAGQYRDQITAPIGRAQCVPQPQHRRRRAFAHQQVIPFRALPAEDAARVAARVGVADAETMAASRELEYFFDGFRWFGTELPGWICSRALSFVTVPETVPASDGTRSDDARARDTSSRVIVSWWRSNQTRVRLRVESFEAASADDARRTLIGVAANVQTPAIEPLPYATLGDAAVTTPGGSLVIFARGNHVHAVRAIAEEALDVTVDARRLDAWLIGAGQPMEADATPLTSPMRLACWNGDARAAGLAVGRGASWQRYVLRRARATRDATGTTIDIRPRGNERAVDDAAAAQYDGSARQDESDRQDDGARRGDGGASVQRFVVSSSDAARRAIVKAGSPWSSS